MGVFLHKYYLYTMKKYSLALRIYHWLMAVVVFLLLGTVFLKKTVFDELTIARDIREFLGQRGVAMNVDDSVELTQTIIHHVWHYHFVIGIAFSVLVLFRIVLFFTPSGRMVLTVFMDFIRKRNKEPNAFRYLVYVLFYLASVILAVTGTWMHLGEASLSYESKELLESIHVGVINLVFLFVPIHLVGVLMAERSDQKGVVSEMINGGEEVKK